MEKVANLAGAQAVQMKAADSDYVDQANALRADAALDVQTLQDWARGRALEITAAQQVWKAAGDANSKLAQSIFDSVSAFGHDPSLPVAAPPLFGEPAPTATQLKFNSSDYDAIVKQLNQLGKKHSTAEELGFLFSYVSAVGSAYESGMSCAAKAAATAKQSGATTVKSAVAAAPPRAAGGAPAAAPAAAATATPSNPTQCKT
jgi:hypothetical protein